MKDGRVRSELRFGRGNRKLLDIQEAAEFCDSLPSGGNLPKFAVEPADRPVSPRREPSNGRSKGERRFTGQFLITY
jgi:hypothetical protein